MGRVCVDGLLVRFLHRFVVSYVKDEVNLTIKIGGAGCVNDYVNVNDYCK